MRLIISVILILISHGIYSQHEIEKQKYFYPEDPMVRQKLEDWQDLKFGLLMHWGPYSQWGIVESWSICPEDYGWCERKRGNFPNDYFSYVKEYENLKLSFNPTRFNPDKWAEAAKKAGMKYVVFTTKHHDGFCMFDSKYTDYKITDPKCPFHVNKKSNITREIFDSFRKQGLWCGTYFSKPDWNSDLYWNPYFPPLNRNVNYDPEIYPDTWKKFTEFTHNQILELMSDYGKIDILWLDGGWVLKMDKEMIGHYYDNKISESKSGFLKENYVNQDIKMDELAAKARKLQPGLIVVDRAVTGKNQNYLTPENTVPESTLPYPWESCIIAGGGWSWVPSATYMSSNKAIHMLIDIVSKGGNLLLNIAPSPSGTWDDGAYMLLEQIGKWMEINGEAIYNSRAIEPFKSGNICFTKNKSSNTVCAFYLAKENEKELPEFIDVKTGFLPDQPKVELLGSKSTFKWTEIHGGFRIMITASNRKSVPCQDAWVFKYKIK
ncbi:MAG: alpha-L-fucosidase [Deltaproteobacteria bacterium]